MSAPLTCVYVADRGFLPCTSFSILSLVDASSIPLDIHLLYADTDTDALGEARGYLESKGIQIAVSTIAENELAGLPRPKSLPLATYGRLVMHRLLPAGLDRVLYIDGDTLVDLDVASLQARPLNGAILGAVVDIGRILIGRREEAQRRLELGPEGDYFNAGVMLIDWGRWREDRVGERTLAALAAEPQRFTQADQCALNYVCRGRWAMLDLVCNFQPACVIHEDTRSALFHFLGGNKPWDGSRNRHPIRFQQRYQGLLADSPWSDRYPRSRLPYPIKAGLRLAGVKLSTRTWSTRGLYLETARRIEALIAASGPDKNNAMEAAP